jgi:hypothetical protein
MNESYMVDGVNVLSLSNRVVNQFITGDLRQHLEVNGIKISKDWRKLTMAEAVRIVRRVEGAAHMAGGEAELDREPEDAEGYCMTIDNVLKMISIQLRLKFDLPTLIMGETGCGKTSLINYLCLLLRLPLRVFNVHGGVTDTEVMAFMRTCCDEADERMTYGLGDSRLIVFFDEINTCNSMGLFKEMLCDGWLGSRKLPRNLKIVAACNPYRLRQVADDETPGLIFEHHNRSHDNVGTGIVDPLQNLVYRVHPLPESMIDLVYDFGALSEDTERLYIKSMLSKKLVIDETRRVAKPLEDAETIAHPHFYGNGRRSSHMLDLLAVGPLDELGSGDSEAESLLVAFTELLCAAQTFVRTVNGNERSACSLRDISRCVTVYRWFGHHFSLQYGYSMQSFLRAEPHVRRHIRVCVVLSLAYCYQARLNRKRRMQFRLHMVSTWRTIASSLRAPAKWLDISSEEFFVRTVDAVQRDFVMSMKLGEGIALNEALCENLFMLLVSVLNHIPIFVVGKPGTSKSLAVELLQSNLNGEASENPFLRSLPSVEVFSYQCSPLSTSEGIEGLFAQGRRYLQEAQNTVVVVLLDEVGLAEQSPHLPLKVLHRELEHLEGISVVGISNWVLDPAKMNRAVHLYRPAPTVDDLALTAEGMVVSANLKGYLRSLALAYAQVYEKQKQRDFWGLREFYSIVRAINTNLIKQSASMLTPDILMSAVLRNFGGRPAEEVEGVKDNFFSCMGLNPSKAVRPSIVELVSQNLDEKDARHMMILTRNNAALTLLYDLSIFKHAKTEIIFGSQFPSDQTDLYAMMNLQRIKSFMAQGTTVVLVACDNLYESLYDLLNQHYCEYGGQRFVRLAFGTHSRLCPIHESFRVVVMVEKADAYNRLAPPLLNRFEKQVLITEHILTSQQISLVKRLAGLMSAILDSLSRKQAHGTDDRATQTVTLEMSRLVVQARRYFCGFYSDILNSLAVSLTTRCGECTSEAELVAEGLRRLLWICTPDAACAFEAVALPSDVEELFSKQLVEVYFHDQVHSDLDQFIDFVKAISHGADSAHAACVSDAHAASAKESQEEKPDRDGKTAAQPDAVLASLPQEELPVTHAQSALVTLMTYSHTVSIRIAHRQPSRVFRVVVLHEVASAQDISRSIEDFFHNAPTGATLIIQCDPQASSFQQIAQTKYFCERMHAKQSDPNRVLVIMLLHLARSAEGAFCFNFDARWHYAFIDTVEPIAENQLPSLSVMLGRSITDVISKLDLSALLLARFRPALASLAYPFTRRSDDIRAQIQHLLKSLVDGEFVQVLSSLLLAMVQQADASNDASWHLKTARSVDMAVTGTFIGSLHRHITETVMNQFAALMAHCDRNENLALYKPECSWKAQLWLKLLQQCAKPNMLLLPHNSRQHEVKSDGTSGVPFKAQFPFSFAISLTIDALRSISEESSSQAEESLLAHFHQTPLSAVQEKFDEEQMFAYTADFTAMHCMHTAAISRSDQARIVYSMCLKITKGPLQLLPVLHSSFWQIETKLHQYFSIMDAIPSCAPNLLELLTNPNAMLPCTALDLVVVDLAMQALESLIHNSTTDNTGSWCASVFRARPIVQTMLTALSDHDGSSAKQCEEIKLRWLKVSFLRCFVLQVGQHLGLSAAQVKELWLAILPFKFSLTAFFEAVVSFFKDLNRAFSREGTLECPMCYSIPLKPQRACGNGDCRQLVCEACIRNYAASPAFKQDRKCFWCRQHVASNSSLYFSDPADCAVVEVARNREDRLVSLVSSFFETLIFEFCFQPDEQPESRLLVALTSLACGVVPAFGRLDTEKSATFLPQGNTFRIAMLRRLLGLPTSLVQNVVLPELELNLCAALQSTTFLDNAVAVCYTAVMEEKIEKQIGVDGALALLTAGSKFGIDPAAIRDASVARLLDAVAATRWLVRRYTNSLTSTAGPDARVADALGQLLASQFECVRSIRMLLLKHVKAQEGISFLRHALQQGGLLSSSPWLKVWRGDKDIGLEQFIGSDRMPQSNPIKLIPLVSELSAAIAAFANTADCATLDLEVAKHAQHPCFAGALVLACFQDIYQLRAVSLDEGAPLDWIELFRTWLRGSPQLQALAPTERQILLFFTDTQRPAAAPTELGHAWDLSPASSTSHVVRLRLMVHIVAVCLRKDPAPLAFMRTIMVKPAVGAFWPTMPDDLKAVMRKALGGGWYACPNGHVYYVDACGKPTEVLACATCGAKIGGVDHELLDDNRNMSEQDDTPPNYCIGAMSDLHSQDISGISEALASRQVPALLLLLAWRVSE